MKTTYTFTKLFLLVAIFFAAVSCSENEKEVVVEPEFPEEEVVSSVTPNGETILTFSANMNWEVTSSAIWCKFANGSTSMKGEAGDVSLSLTITEDAWSVEESVVEITLKMGSEEKVIARYTRAGKAMSLADANGVAYDDNNVVVFKYTDTFNGVNISFKTNYDWIIEDTPEWIEVENAPLSGTSSELSTINIKVADKFKAFAKKDYINVYNKNKKEEYCKIPVTYWGIDRVSSDINAGTAYVFDATGQKYDVNGEFVEGPLSINNILINGDNYQIVYLSKSNQYSYTGASLTSDWMNCEISRQAINAEAFKAVVSVDANTDTNMKFGEVLVVPTDTLEAAGGLSSVLNTTNGLNEKLGNYILVRIAQKGEEIVTEVPFAIESAPAASFVLKSDLTEEEKAKYPGDVYVCTLKAHTDYQSFVIRSEQYPHNEEGPVMWRSALDMGKDWAKPWTSANYKNLTGSWNDWFNGYAFNYSDSQWYPFDGISAEHGYDTDGTPIPYVIYIVESSEGLGENIVATLILEREAD